MGRKVAWAVAAAAAAAWSCGGDDTHIPDAVDRAMAQVSASLTDEDATEDDVCEALVALQRTLWDWQEHARGNFVVRIDRATQHLAPTVGPCELGRAGPLDVAAVADSYDRWSKDLRREFAMSGSSGKMFGILLAAVGVAAFLVFWKRKFHEA